MGIQNEIDRINNNISDTYDNLETLGATMPSVLNSNNLPDTVNSVVVVKDVKDSVTGVSFVDANRVAQLNIPVGEITIAISQIIQTTPTVKMQLTDAQMDIIENRLLLEVDVSVLGLPKQKLVVGAKQGKHISLYAWQSDRSGGDDSQAYVTICDINTDTSVLTYTNIAKRILDENDYDALDDGKVDKVASPVEGNVATLTNDGNIEDSGYGIQQASEVSIVYNISSSSTNGQVPSALSVYNYIEQHGGGTITDVTVDGTSVVEDGVAKIISPTITEQDVKTALGYTPYNATNPDGYQTSVQVESAITSKGYTTMTAVENKGYQTSTQVNTAITNHNTSNAAHEDIRIALSGKQASLVSGENIKTINNESILGPGNLQLAGSWDELTDKPFDSIGEGLSVNEDGELEADGGGVPAGGIAGDMIVKNSSTDGDASWKHCQAIYVGDSEGGSAETIDADLLDGKSLQTILGLIYPVGAIYTSQANTNPATLFGFGTWVKIAEKLPIGENVMGNGYGLGITNGTKNGTLKRWGTNQQISASANIATNVLPTTAGGQLSANNDEVLGVPTKQELGDNPEYSGLIMDTITINVWQRSA